MTIALHLAAAAALLPACLAAWCGDGRGRNWAFWPAFALAALVAAGWAVAQLQPAWNPAFGTALWLAVASALAAFLALSCLVAELWRLGPLLAPYLLALALAAGVWGGAPAPGGMAAGAWLALPWFALHVALALAAYALVTLAAVAGVAAMCQERALKRRRPARLARLLPSLADSERMEYRLLAAGWAALAANIATGMAARHGGEAALLAFDHKTVLTLAAFATIAVLLAARRWRGTRGRQAAHLALAGWLLMTLAWPGVKFVTDVLIGA